MLLLTTLYMSITRSLPSTPSPVSVEDNVNISIPIPFSQEDDDLVEV